MAEGEEAPVPDDPSIPDHVFILRTINPEFPTKVRGAEDKPSSQGFCEVYDARWEEKAMSVYRTDILDDHGLDWEVIIQGDPTWGIVKLPVSRLRQEGCRIAPRPEPEKPGGIAHCHVFGLTRPKRSRLADAAEWIKRPQPPPADVETNGD